MNHALWTAFVVMLLTVSSLSASAQTQVIYQHRQFDGRAEGFPAGVPTNDTCCGVGLQSTSNGPTFAGTYDPRTAGMVIINGDILPAGNRFYREWEQFELSNMGAGPGDFAGTDFYGTLGAVNGAVPRTFVAPTGLATARPPLTLMDQGQGIVTQMNTSARRLGTGNFGPNVGPTAMGTFVPGTEMGTAMVPVTDGNGNPIGITTIDTTFNLGGIVRITPGANRYGGTMDLLGGIQAQAFVAIGSATFAEVNVPFPQGAQPGGLDLGTDLGGVRGTVAFTNFIHTSTPMGPIVNAEQDFVFLTEFPWTTGTITMTDNGDAAMGMLDMIVDNGGGAPVGSLPAETLQLVKPVLVNINSNFVPEPTIATYHRVEYEFVPEPSSMAAMGIGVMGLVGLVGLRRKQTS